MRVTTLIPVVVIRVGECGDHGSPGPTSNPPTKTDTTTDQQSADDAVLVGSDLLGGWTPVTTVGLTTEGTTGAAPRPGE
jgi:hypothetical protein